MSRALVAAGLLAGGLLGGAAVLVALAGTAASRPDVASLAGRAPRQTALMRQRAAEARREGRPHRIDQRWMPYGRISPLLRRAVLIAEDDAFFRHGGLDWNEIRTSMRRNLEARRLVRGGSTITQQLARNLFLGNERTVTRKLKEVLLARRIERTLTKRRIFELYLNLIEWGDGVYGAEAAARRSFRVSASDLDPRQAALLAAVIINPRRYSAARPSRRIERRAGMILARMWKRGLLSEDQYQAAIGRPPRRPGFMEWFFGPPPDTLPPPAGAPGRAAGDSAGAPADTDTALVGRDSPGA